jgi:large subunit ribosomal protein L7/L12
MSDKLEKIITEVEGLSILEMADLVKKMEEKFGVSAAVAVAGGGGGAEGGAEEKDSFNVVLTSGGEQKIQVIKAIKEILGLGLKEAKDLVDNAPSPIKEGAKKAEADEIKEKIETAGGVIELQ